MNTSSEELQDRCAELARNILIATKRLAVQPEPAAVDGKAPSPGKPVTFIEELRAAYYDAFESGQLRGLAAPMPQAFNHALDVVLNVLEGIAHHTDNRTLNKKALEDIFIGLGPFEALSAATSQECPSALLDLCTGMHALSMGIRDTKNRSERSPIYLVPYSHSHVENDLGYTAESFHTWLYSEICILYLALDDYAASLDTQQHDTKPSTRIWKAHLAAASGATRSP